MCHITQFNNNVERVLTSLSLLNKRVIKPRGIEDPCELVKVWFKMLQLICSATTSQTIQKVAKVTCQFVYDERLQDEYSLNNVQEDVLISAEKFLSFGPRISGPR